jgi:hypothetical protein
MVDGNPAWRARRFQDYILKSNFEVLERAVAHYVRRPISPDSARQL